MIVAIDGPAAAGKSTVARQVAARIGATYLDSGAIYRAVTWAALARGVDLDDPRACGDLAETLEIRLAPGDPHVLVSVDGREVTREVRASDVSEAVSRVAAHTPVRRAVTELSRKMMARGDWVCDGRDVGTVIVPNADVKVFLTADPARRAERRLRDLEASGHDHDLQRVLDDIVRRDHLDSTRADSPLTRAADAVVVDSSTCDADEVVEVILELVRTRVEAV